MSPRLERSLAVSRMVTLITLSLVVLLALFLGIFWITALVGRVWCGYGCPQSVYLELLFRPIERLIEGGPSAQKRISRGGLSGRRLLKYTVFAGLSMATGESVAIKINAATCDEVRARARRSISLPN